MHFNHCIKHYESTCQQLISQVMVPLIDETKQNETKQNTTTQKTKQNKKQQSEGLVCVKLERCLFYSESRIFHIGRLYFQGELSVFVVTLFDLSLQGRAGGLRDALSRALGGAWSWGPETQKAK